MMGKRHFLSGATTGGAYCTLIDAPMIETPLIIMVVMYFALLPDIDCPGSTVTESIPLIGRSTSWLVRRLSHVVYRVTKGPRDEDWEGTHRHLSHTVVFAIFVGVLVQVPLSLLIGPGHALVYAGATALGCWTHCLGDSLTEMGCPWLWPVPIAGETWYEIRTPRIIRFKTGKGAERYVVEPLLYVGAVVAFPGALPVILPLIMGAYDTLQPVMSSLVNAFS